MLAALIALLAHAEVRADSDVSDRIAQLDASISAAPKGPAVAPLLLSRAELHRLDLEWQKSLDDLDAASELDPKLEDLELHRGLTLFRSGRLHEAIVALNGYLSSHGRDGFAWIQLGRALSGLELHAESADAFAQAIQLSKQPAPGLVLEMSDAIQAQGPSQYATALKSIESGIARIGPAISLELRALELEQRLGLFDDALSRLSRIAGEVQSKAPWLLRKGKILLLANRVDEADRALEQAKALALKMPPSRREAPANVEMIRSIEDLLAIVRD